MNGAATLAIVESSRSMRAAASAAANASQRQRSVVVVEFTTSSFVTERIILFRILIAAGHNHIGQMERLSPIDSLRLSAEALLERNDPLRYGRGREHPTPQRSPRRGR